MRTLGVGIAVPIGAPPEQLVAAIRKAAEMRADVPAEMLYGRYGELMQDYYDAPLVDLMETVSAPDLPRVLGRVNGYHSDGWCAATVSFRLWSARPPQRLALDLWVPAEAEGSRPSRLPATAPPSSADRSTRATCSASSAPCRRATRGCWISPARSTSCSCAAARRAVLRGHAVGRACQRRHRLACVELPGAGLSVLPGPVAEAA